MDDFTGIQLLQSIQNPPKVILTTAFDSFALKGYELGVDDYLLKPYSFSRFIQAVERVFKLLSSNKVTTIKLPKNSSEENKTKDYIFVKDGHEIKKIILSNIIYIEGMKDYLTIKTIDKKVYTLLNFMEMEKLLPSDNFIRVHKSYIVAINKIESIKKNQISVKDKQIPIGNTYKKAFFKKLNQ